MHWTDLNKIIKSFLSFFFLWKTQIRKATRGPHSFVLDGDGGVGLVKLSSETNNKSLHIKYLDHPPPLKPRRDPIHFRLSGRRGGVFSEQSQKFPKLHWY